MAVLADDPSVTSVSSVPDIQVNVADDTQAVSGPNDADLPVPPEIPDLPPAVNVTLPSKLADFSPERQAAITAYIEKHYPNTKSATEIEAVAELLIKAVAEYYAGNAKTVILLSVKSTS
jgi:hypothetical protein